MNKRFTRDEDPCYLTSYMLRSQTVTLVAEHWDYIPLAGIDLILWERKGIQESHLYRNNPFMTGLNKNILEYVYGDLLDDPTSFS